MNNKHTFADTDMGFALGFAVSTVVSIGGFTVLKGIEQAVLPSDLNLFGKFCVEALNTGAIIYMFFTTSGVYYRIVEMFSDVKKAIDSRNAVKKHKSRPTDDGIHMDFEEWGEYLKSKEKETTHGKE